MTTFADLGLPRPIVQVLSKQGITEPFPIQQAAIPDALAGKDVLGRGPTAVQAGSPAWLGVGTHPRAGNPDPGTLG